MIGVCKVEGSAKGLQTVQRAVRLLQCFTVNEPEISLTKLTQKLNLPKSTTARLIDTLIDVGMLERNETNFNYKLGHSVYVLGRVAEISNDVVQLATPLMKQLRDETNESVALFKIDGNKRVCVQRFVSLEVVTHNVSIGSKLELVIGATGKSLLAFQSNEFIKELVETVQDQDRLMQQLEEIRTTNQALSIDERGAGVNAISSAIFSISGNVKYSLSITGPSMRFTEEKMKQWQDRLLKDANKLSQELGFVFK